MEVPMVVSVYKLLILCWKEFQTDSWQKDDSIKIFNYKKGIQGFKVKKSWKQVKDGARGLLYVEQKLILRYLLSLF